MDAVWIMVAVAAVVALVIVAIGAFQARGDKASMKKWLVGGVVALGAIVLALFGLGRKRTPTVIEVTPHERTVAPGEAEKALLDEDARRTADEAADLREAGVALDERAKVLDAKLARLEERADETDTLLATTPNASPDGDNSREPDPDLVDLLR